jgi:hypothetical protein
VHINFTNKEQAKGQQFAVNLSFSHSRIITYNFGRLRHGFIFFQIKTFQCRLSLTEIIDLINFNSDIICSSCAAVLQERNTQPEITFDAPSFNTSA